MAAAALTIILAFCAGAIVSPISLWVAVAIFLLGGVIAIGVMWVEMR